MGCKSEPVKKNGSLQYESIEEKNREDLVRNLHALWKFQ